MVHSRYQRCVRWAGQLCGGAALVAAVLIAAARWYIDGGRILPGVHIAGIAVGGMTAEQARTAVHLAHPWPRGSVQLYHGGREWEVPEVWLTPPPDVTGSVAGAWAVGRGGWLQGAVALLRGYIAGFVIPMGTAPPAPELNVWLARVAGAIYRPPVDESYDPDLQRWVAAQEGQQLDRAATLTALRAAAGDERTRVPAVVRTLPARRVPTEMRRWHAIAGYTTRVVNLEPGRLHNIDLATRHLDGTVVPPGGEFSFNRVVGPRTPERGWQPATEIYNGEFVPGYGGGICQVSSTLYNAVLVSGLAVVERHHHSRPLSYVPLGQDATVAWGSLDLRFRNNTAAPLRLAVRLVRTEPPRVVVAIVGPQPVATATLASEVTHITPPETVEVVDRGLAPGVREVARPGLPGYDVVVYRITGKENRTRVSTARYLPRPIRVRVGPGSNIRAPAAGGATLPPPLPAPRHQSLSGAGNRSIGRLDVPRTGPYNRQ